MNDNQAADAELEIAVAQTDADHATVTLTGRLDVLEASRLREQLAGANLAGARHLLIDLAAVTFVDSAGLAVLARARRDRLAGDGTLTVVRPTSDDAMRVFRLTQFDQILTMIDRPESSSA
ncbi:MAG: STAS domain-containing protein [Rhodococcus sp. (in: high G+C Gram-positive bacteria)]